MMLYKEDVDILRAVIKTRSIHLEDVSNSIVKDKLESVPIKYLFTIPWSKTIAFLKLRELMFYQEKIIMQLFLVTL